MLDLFKDSLGEAKAAGHRPLAIRMRPRTLDEVAGQDSILGPGKLLRRAIEADRLTSLVLYGPPGCGKTTLAEVIAHQTGRRFVRTSGVLANVAILRGILQEAARVHQAEGRDTLLFIDEIHRFSKSQQDTLLPYLEEGWAILIGATTHNPFYFVNSPLLSRSQVFQLDPLSEAAMGTLLDRALTHPEGFADRKVALDPAARVHLARVCEGDARRALNALEIAVLTTPPGEDGMVRVNLEAAAESIQTKPVRYDHDEDEHYDTISAFIKSVRGSDPDAAIYWLAKMIEAGEDPRFLARRLVILAAEDIGNADPRGLSVAVAAFHGVELVGMPEARILLAQATTYLACAPKSNASYLAVDAALDDIRTGRVQPVPRHLRDSSHKAAARAFGHQGYQYAHDAPGHTVDQVYLEIPRTYYEPTDQGYEQTIRQRLAWFRERRAEQAREREGERNEG